MVKALMTSTRNSLSWHVSLSFKSVLNYMKSFFGCSDSEITNIDAFVPLRGFVGHPDCRLFWPLC